MDTDGIQTNTPGDACAGFRETFGLSFAGEYRTNDFGAQKGHESC